MFIFGVLKKEKKFFYKLTFITLVLITVTLVLGFWQLNRLEWKNNLIKAFDELKHSTPKKINILKQEEFFKVEFFGMINRNKKIFLPAKTLNGKVGMRLASVFIDKDGNSYLLDEGWFSQDKFNFFRASNKKIEENITAYIRFPRKKNFFTPDNNIKTNEWYTYDLLSIGKFLNTPINQKFFLKKMNKNIDKDLIPSSHHHQFRNNHWQYAITWFLMSFAFLVLYLVYLKKRYD